MKTRRQLLLITLVLMVVLFCAPNTYNVPLNSDTYAQDLNTQHIISSTSTVNYYPNAAGTYSDWTDYPSAGDDYDKIDEVSADDDSTYILAGSTEWETSVNIQDSSGRSEVIEKVRVYVRAKEVSSAVDLWYGTLLSGTHDSSADIAGSLTTSYQDFYTDFVTDPSGGGWSWSDIDSLQLFVKGKAAARNTERVTQLYCVVYYTDAPSNNAPTNDGTPTCSNLDDTDNLYAHAKQYTIVQYGDDADGYADIDYMELSIYSNDRVTKYYTVKYDEDTDTFSESYDPSGIAVLDVSSSSDSRSGTACDVTYYITIDWDFTDFSDMDILCYIIDDEPESDSDYYEVNWDIETRTDFSSFSLSDGSGTVDRGDINGIDTITASGTVIYYSGTVNPPTGEVDVWVSCSDVAGSPWSDLTLSSGVFSMTVDSDDVVGLDTYTFIVVEESAGSGGSDLNHATHTDTYIADRVQVSGYSVSDSRVNINDNVNIDVTLIYDYDDTAVTDGTVTINGAASSHQGSGVWRITDSESSVMANTYDTIAYSGGTHGITEEDQNGQSTTVIWDRVQVSGYSIVGGDDRINIDDTLTLDVTIIYDYDNAAVTDGTVTINGIAASHQGSGVWRITDTESTVLMNTYDTVACSGNTYGITSIDQNGQSETCIWDRVQVSGYSVSDSRVNINDNVNIDVTLIYDYDDSQVTDGTVTINGEAASHQGSGVWRITDSEAAVGDNTYDTVACSGNTYGITAIDQNGQDTTVIWDSITITIVGPTDNRQNLNANASGIIVSAVYDYDSTVFDGSFTMNNTDYNGDGTAVKWGYTVSSVSGDSYGITVISTNDETYMIWDSLTVTFTGPSDQRINIGDNCSGMYISIVYDYDGAVFDGTYNLNDTTFLYNVVGIHGYTISSVNGDDSYGITTISSNDDTYCIWDSITITITGPTDQRININANASGIVITAVYDYDNAVFDGSFTLNDTTYDHGVVGKYGYTVSSVSGDSYGITVISTNDETYCIFDSLTITITGPSDNRININANASGIIVSAVYDYDGLPYDGTFTLNDTTFDYGVVGKYGYTVSSANGDDTYGITEISVNDDTYCIFDSLTVVITGPTDNRIDINANASGIVINIYYDYDNAVYDGTYSLNNTQFIYSTVQRQGYTINSVNGDDSYGITTISTNDDTYCIWDRVIFTTSVNYGWTVIYYNTTLSYTAIYDYDDTPYLGTALFNSSGDTLYPTYTTTGLRSFGIDTIDDSAGYGLTEYTTDYTDVTWDKVVCSSISYTWEMYDLIQIQMLLDTGVFSWEINGTNIGINQNILVYVNNTLQIDDDTDASSEIPDTYIGPFSQSWYYGHFVGNASTTVGARSFVNIFWDTTISIPISHTIHLADFDIIEYDDYIWFMWSTVWNNGTFSLFDNGTLIAYVEDDPGTYRLTKGSMFTYHNLTLLFNCTDSGDNELEQTASGGLSDYWIYVSYHYGIALGTDVYYTIVMTYPQDFPLQSVNSRFVVYPEWSGYALLVLWGDLDNTTTIALVDFIDSGPDFTFYNGQYFIIGGYNMLVFPLTEYHLLSMASRSNTLWGISGIYQNFTVSYRDTVTTSGSLSITTIDENIHNYADCVSQSGNIINTGMYIVLGDAELYPGISNTLIVDFTVYLGGTEYEYDTDQPNPAMILLFKVYIDGQYFGYAYSQAFDLGGDNYQLVLYSPVIDFTQFVQTTDIYLYCMWGIGLAWNQTTYVDGQVAMVYPYNTNTLIPLILTLGADYQMTYITPYRSDGEGVDLITFKLYINGTRIYDRDWKFYNRSDYVYEVCVQDYYGNELYNTTHSWSRNIDILLQYYTIKIYSQLQEDPIHFMLSYGGTTRSEYLGLNEILYFYLAANIYSYTFTKGGQSFVGSIDISSADAYYTVTELDLWDVWDKAGSNAGGGDDDEVEYLIWYGIVGIFGFLAIIQSKDIYKLLKKRPKLPQQDTGRGRRYR